MMIESIGTILCSLMVETEKSVIYELNFWYIYLHIILTLVILCLERIRNPCLNDNGVGHGPSLAVSEV